MDEKNQTEFSPEIKKFIDSFLSLDSGAKKISDENERTISSALIYEKIRTAFEYQEDHLLFKNAMARILRRRLTLGINATASELEGDLIAELAWSNYINPELIKEDQHKEIIKIIERYLVLLKNIRSGFYTKNDLHKMIFNWLACEIDEVFHPSQKIDLFLDYVYKIYGDNLSIPEVKINDSDSELLLKIIIYSLVIKPDYYSVQYWLLKHIYPDWKSKGNDEIAKIARSFDPYFNKINKIIRHQLYKEYYSYVKKNIAPFILLYWVLMTEKLDFEKNPITPKVLQSMIMQQYDKSINEVKDKVWRGTYRALIFILLTKVSLAFLIEIPFDRYVAGEINYLTLAINILTPPLLMLAAGTFVKSPPVNNRKYLADAVESIIVKNQLIGPKTNLIKKRTDRSSQIFNLLYSIFSLVILIFVIKLLVYLQFNFVSILLFFLFVSAVSFFSFRIRSMALELAMKRSRDDALTSALEFILLPFIRIGKYLSDRLAAFNPFILALDFLIEAPLKTIIKIFNSWLRFVNSKKEDLEY